MEMARIRSVFDALRQITYPACSWGVINDRSGGWYYCFTTGDIVSAVQSGRQIVLDVYGKGNTVKCGDVFTLTAP
ncbi:Uncharacterised protein [Chromobacterium vaccinii]|nr:Uncharacterised protein [Chromobacterium vaccinii]